MATGARLFLSLCGGACLTGIAEAAPWPQRDDGFYTRILVAAESLNGVEGVRADAYGEWGLTTDWTLIAKAEGVRYDSADYLDGEHYRLSARRGIWSSKGWQIGAELGAVHYTAASGFAGCAGTGGEARMSGGITGVLNNQAYYAFADLGIVALNSGCTRPRLEVGYGLDITPRTFIGQQVWIERGNQGDPSNKYETMIGVHFDRFDLALGYRDTFSTPYDEAAIVLTLVRRN
jgi:hypothetical protein